MNVEVDGSDLAQALEDKSKEATSKVARNWFSTSQEMLLDRGGDAGYEVHSIVKRAQPPVWEEDAWVFTYNHMAAKFFEYGTEPHTIEAKEAEFLAFEWPDAPQWVREQFEDTFPTVFFKKVEHPGTPALRFLRDSRDKL